ncbi:uncharacterized protein BJ212DRAFT_1482220 [Suillus subaureus]|uniref:Large ribosomal subunit protein uL2 RNA-binding domain-containing protein n=1 Tax=Suillus subaureus TaxID=48587 RepID=A0A9P7JC69_9AGAM|nr:uncharacterized protein BJ212DRAFT_1482220 [Suillus subaureus]KAG1813865.1 hypothetical protein BJ212DRAFT_1482220 [Suillus subaureus]
MSRERVCLFRANNIPLRLAKNNFYIFRFSYLEALFCRQTAICCAFVHYALFRQLGAPSSSRALTHVFQTTTATNSIARTYATHFTRGSKDEPKATSLDVDNNVFKTYKPVSPGIRHLRRPINDHIYQGRPVRLLTACLRKHGGRNSHGRITVRFRGGGHKRRVRLIDFLRTEPGEYDVIRIEYDPGRSAHIALIKARDANTEGKAKWKYILATEE